MTLVEKGRVGSAGLGVIRVANVFTIYDNTDEKNKGKANHGLYNN